jgi:mono/diheme cytochrome c family protein
VFLSAGCSGCHTLKAADASGNVGPNLDTAKPLAALVAARVSRGKGGMPSFAGQLSDAQISAVAAFVASSAGR